MSTAMPPMSYVEHVIVEYGLTIPTGVEALGGAGGFSGARLWKLSFPDGPPLCLRRWPERTTAARVKWVHAIIKHAAAHGCDFLAEPRLTTCGQTWVEFGGHCFELAPWMSGVADFCDRASESRLGNTMRALARFHLATAGLAAEAPAVPPAVSDRLERLRQLEQGGAEQIRRLAMNPHPLLRADEVTLILDAYYSRRDEVQRALVGAQASTRLVPCLRDVWHDHILFEGDRVSGIVDYDAIRHDSVATDLSRLLASLLSGDRSSWLRAIEAYAQDHPLSAAERSLIFALDGANGVLAGMQWLEWLSVRKIEFENGSNVRRRIEGIVNRLLADSF